LYVLANYLYNNRRFILNLTKGTPGPTLYKGPQFSGLQNFNIFTADKTFMGGKIGKSTSAQETYLGIFEVDFDGTKRSMVIITLGTSDVTGDVNALLQYSKENY
jgi:hypothetical protein